MNGEAVDRAPQSALDTPAMHPYYIVKLLYDYACQP